jgi:hypothetical protein
MLYAGHHNRVISNKLVTSISMNGIKACDSILKLRWVDATSPSTAMQFLEIIKTKINFYTYTLLSKRKFSEKIMYCMEFLGSS